MKNIFSLFQGVFTFFKTISKSMYRRCAIIASGSAVIAVVCLNSTCYGGGGKNNVVTSFYGTGQAGEAVEEEDEDTEEEKRMFASLIVGTAQTTECMSKPLLSGFTESGFKKYKCVYADVEADANGADEADLVLVSADYINPIITITEEDYNNLVRIVEAEATDADVVAKILVANVVINRVFSDVFPDNVTEVIFQGNGVQFQPIMDGRFYSVEPKDSSYEAVDRALVGEDYSEGALFFAATASAGEGSWFATHLRRLFEYEGHVFFTFIQ